MDPVDPRQAQSGTPAQQPTQPAVRHAPPQPAQQPLAPNQPQEPRVQGAQPALIATRQASPAMPASKALPNAVPPIGASPSQAAAPATTNAPAPAANAAGGRSAAAQPAPRETDVELDAVFASQRTQRPQPPMDVVRAAGQTPNPNRPRSARVSHQQLAQQARRVAGQQANQWETFWDVVGGAGRRGAAGTRAAIHFAFALFWLCATCILTLCFVIVLIVLPAFATRYVPQLDHPHVLGTFPLWLTLPVVIVWLALLVVFNLQMINRVLDGQDELRRATGGMRKSVTVVVPSSGPYVKEPRMQNQPQPAAAQPRSGMPDQAGAPPPASADPAAGTAPAQPAPLSAPNPVLPSPSPPSPPPPVPSPKLDAAPFQTHEPEDKSDPFPHTDPVGKVSRDGWVIVGSSRRGFSHEHDKKYREDALAAGIQGPWHLVAVADGGGAYEKARVGANVAVNNALAAMVSYIQTLGQVEAPADATALAAAMRQILLDGLRAAYDAVYDEAKSRDNMSVKELRTTLLLLAHREFRQGMHLVGGAQIGDGVIVVRDGSGSLHSLCTPDTGPSGNEVLFLQDVDPIEWEKRTEVKLIIGDNGFHCLVITDGVADDFLPIEDNLIRLERPLFETVLAGKTPEEAKYALTDLLGYKRDASFDDRTLVCIYKPTVDTAR